VLQKKATGEQHFFIQYAARRINAQVLIVQAAVRRDFNNLSAS